jgi:hypothetical protein
MPLPTNEIETTVTSVHQNRGSFEFNNTVEVKTVVLVTNFMCQHSVWTSSLAEIERLLHDQAREHGELAERLQLIGLNYRRIFFSGIAVHGFRTSGLTPARQRWFNEKAQSILGSRGWEILDVYNVSLARPDGTNDGVHYQGGVSTSFVDIMLNTICNKECHSKN